MWEVKIYILFELKDGTKVIKNNLIAVNSEKIKTEKAVNEYIFKKHKKSFQPLVNIDDLNSEIKSQTLQIESIKRKRY